MTSYEFEIAAKNAVIDILKLENRDTNSLDLVWFAHELGNKKCMIWGKEMGNKYAEVTYDRDNNIMYVDVYVKIVHKDIMLEDLDFKYHTNKII